MIRRGVTPVVAPNARGRHRGTAPMIFWVLLILATNKIKHFENVPNLELDHYFGVRLSCPSLNLINNLRAWLK